MERLFDELQISISKNLHLRLVLWLRVTNVKVHVYFVIKQCAVTLSSMVSRFPLGMSSMTKE